jgi:hypothetical protein
MPIIRKEEGRIIVDTLIESTSNAIERVSEMIGSPDVVFSIIFKKLDTKKLDKSEKWAIILLANERFIERNNLEVERATKAELEKSIKIIGNLIIKYL